MTCTESQRGDDVGNPKGQHERASVEALEEPVEEESPQAEDKSTEQNLFADARAEGGDDGNGKFGMREPAKVIDGCEELVSDDEQNAADQTEQERDDEPAPPVPVRAEDAGQVEFACEPKTRETEKPYTTSTIPALASPTTQFGTPISGMGMPMLVASWSAKRA
jgi:hypothetical protein